MFSEKVHPALAVSGCRAAAVTLSGHAVISSGSSVVDFLWLFLYVLVLMSLSLLFFLLFSVCLPLSMFPPLVPLFLSLLPFPPLICSLAPR